MPHLLNGIPKIQLNLLYTLGLNPAKPYSVFSAQTCHLPQEADKAVWNHQDLQGGNETNGEKNVAACTSREQSWAESRNKAACKRTYGGICRCCRAQGSNNVFPPHQESVPHVKAAAVDIWRSGQCCCYCSWGPLMQQKTHLQSSRDVPPPLGSRLGPTAAAASVNDECALPS